MPGTAADPAAGDRTKVIDYTTFASFCWGSEDRYVATFDANDRLSRLTKEQKGGDGC